MFCALEKRRLEIGGIVENAVYGIIGRAVLLFVILPAGIILIGYIIFIVTQTIRELRKK